MVSSSRPSRVGTLLMLALISAFPPLSTDLYIPALPEMVTLFHTTAAKANLTLAAFFFVYAGMLLFWGPLSEKYGRKGPLLAGIAIYILGSVGCLFAPDINALIAMRIVQACGGAASTAISTAIVKDLFDGRERERVMAVVMMLTVLVPILAPILGAFLLNYFSWRSSFICFILFGAVAFVVTLFFQESLKEEERYNGRLSRSWGRLFTVLGNRGFRSLLVPFSVTQITILSFIGSASYIYIQQFGLSEQQFSFFFSFNAICAIGGMLSYLKLSKKINWSSLLNISFCGIIIAGVLQLFVAPLSPWLFAISMIPGTLGVTSSRVPTTNLMLEQMEGDTGSVSSLINFFTMAFGALGMLVTSLFPGQQLLAMGVLNVVLGLFCSVSWWRLARNGNIKMLPDSVE